MRQRLCYALIAAAGTAAAANAAFQGNLVVSSYGDGTAALSNASTQINLLDFTAGLTSASLNGSLALPSTGNGPFLTGSGTATSEGTLTRSADGRYLTIAGYNASAGLASIAGTAATNVNRAVARVDLDQNVEIVRLAADAYTANNIRSVVTTDGTKYWAGGTASGTNGGVRYFEHDTSGPVSSTLISASPTNTRVVNIFDGQLYVSTQSGAFRGVNTVGTGLPETSGQTTTLLSGFDPSTSAPQNAYDFWFASDSILYVADERSNPSNPGGLQKWVLDAGTWSLQWSLFSLNNDGDDQTPNVNVGLRGLTGTVDDDGAIILYGITSNSGLNHLVSFRDLPGSTSLPIDAEFNLLYTAAPNTVLRGVDFTPIPTPGSLALLGIAGALAARRRRA